MRPPKAKPTSILLLIFLCGVACSQTAKHIDYDKSECSYCRMIIDRKQFGGEFETHSGKIFAFDAIECLAASYYREWNVPIREIKSISFVNCAKPGTLLEQPRAFFVKTNSVESPMVMNFIAFSTRSAAATMKKRPEDSIKSWKGWVKFMRDSWHLPPQKKAQ